VIRKAIVTLTVSLTSILQVGNTHAVSAPFHPPVPATVRHLIEPKVMHQWTRVYICETHNWAQRGHYAGGLGITQWNWEHHGGLRFAAVPYLATPEQQVYVATLIQHGLPVPDQKGDCHDW